MPPKLKKTLASRGKRPRRSPSPPRDPLPWPFKDAAHQRRYNVISDREIVPSKFMDQFTVNHLGLIEEVQLYINRLGWESIAFNDVPTYKEVVLEILSSLTSTFSAYNDTREVNIHFRCMGKDHDISLDGLNAMFGLPTDGATWLPPEGFSEDTAWRTLTGMFTYSARQSKSTKLQSHALRYMHRFMVHSLFGRGESTGVVNRNELYFLHAMTTGERVNTGAWILRHLLHVARQKTDKICVGGLLTMMATSVGFVPENTVVKRIRGTLTIDLESLVKMKMCKSIGGGHYRLLDEYGEVMDEGRDDGDAQCAAEGGSEGMRAQQEEEQPHRSSQQMPAASQSTWTYATMMETLLGRLEQMETSLHNRLDQMEERLDRIERRE